MVVKKKHRDITNLEDLGSPSEPSFDTMGLSDDMGLSDSNNPQAVPLDAPDSALEKLATDVIKALVNEAVPPTPTNFQAYFERMLDDLSDEDQEEILSMMDLEDSNSDEQAIALEQKIKGAFTGITSLLTTSSNLYKNMTLMSRILSKRQSELAGIKDPALKAVIKALQGDVSKLSNILDKQIGSMKTHYQSTANIVKEVEQGSIFDQQFGVYNKRYLLERLSQESAQITQFKHNSSLVTVTLTKEIRNMIPSTKAVLLMEKTVARLLMKTSRRSDVVAHYSEGVFAMLLKHTDLVNAERASNRLIDLVKSTNFFLGDKEIILGVNIGIAKISPTRSAEETLLATIEAMNQISLSKEEHVLIYPEDNV